MNESLEERVAQRTRELETLNEVSREISSRLELQQVLNSVTEKARALLGGEVASLCLVDESRHWLKLQAMSGPPEAVEGQVVAASGGLVGEVLTSTQAMRCGVGDCENGCRMLAQGYRLSHLAAPLRMGERVIGALCVGSAAQGQFTEEAGGMLTKLANVAAIALENARLYAQAERLVNAGRKREEKPGRSNRTTRKAGKATMDNTSQGALRCRHAEPANPSQGKKPDDRLAQNGKGLKVYQAHR